MLLLVALETSRHSACEQMPARGQAPSQSTYAAHARLRCAFFAPQSPAGGAGGGNAGCRATASAMRALLVHRGSRCAATLFGMPVRSRPSRGMPVAVREDHAYRHRPQSRPRAWGVGFGIPKNSKVAAEQRCAVCRRPRHTTTAARRRKWRGRVGRKGMRAGWNGASSIPSSANAELSRTRFNQDIAIGERRVVHLVLSVVRPQTTKNPSAGTALDRALRDALMFAPNEPYFC